MGVFPTPTERALPIGPPPRARVPVHAGWGQGGAPFLMETCASGAEERDSAVKWVAPWGRLLPILPERDERWASACGCGGLQPASLSALYLRWAWVALLKGSRGALCHDVALAAPLGPQRP